MSDGLACLSKHNFSVHKTALCRLVAAHRELHNGVTVSSASSETHTFLYFAYGSNLLKERLQLKNPSASIHCVARLKDYKLIFGNYKGLASDRWHGGVATIENSPADEVWGVVWRMNVADLESLDSQENVRLGAYSPVEVNVKTRGQELNCRTYIMNSCIYAPPSPQYLKVILMGAEQNGLPKNYQEKLRAIETNKFEGPLPVCNITSISPLQE
uniref:Gamma-glutamylcyclotransferase b n=1 Tax=Hucho hucho TaxID=62062 RepID=A0A4W5R7J1_9TELE